MKNNIRKIINKNKKKVFLETILSILVILFIVVLASLFFDKGNIRKVEQVKEKLPIVSVLPKKGKPSEDKNNDKFELSASINPEIIDILGKVYSVFNVSVDNSSLKGGISTGNQGTVCSSENGEKMCESESPSVRWLIRAMDVKENLFATFSSIEIEEIKNIKVRFLTLIKEEFTKNNFINNVVNKDSYDSEFFENYYLFSKNDIKCVVSSEILSEKYTAIAVTCSDQYRKNYQYKVKLINDLGDELNESARTRPLGSVSLFDRYGIFKFSGPSQSFLVIGMMDANNKWHSLWQGFTGDGLPCELLDNYPIFKENYSTPYCYYREGERTGEYVKWD